MPLKVQTGDNRRSKDRLSIKYTKLKDIVEEADGIPVNIENPSIKMNRIYLQAQCDLQEIADSFKLLKKTRIGYYGLPDIFLEEPCITGSKDTTNRREHQFKVNDCGITLDNVVSPARKDDINDKRFAPASA